MFNFKIDKEKIEKSFAKITKNDNIDFGLLDETFQKKIISRLLSNKRDTGKLIRLNPYLSYPGDIANKDELIQNNMRAVLNSYNKTLYREKLVSIYSRVISKPVSHCINKNILLSAFLDLEQFSLLKWNATF